MLSTEKTVAPPLLKEMKLPWAVSLRLRHLHSQRWWSDGFYWFRWDPAEMYWGDHMERWVGRCMRKRRGKHQFPFQRKWEDKQEDPTETIWFVRMRVILFYAKLSWKLGGGLIIGTKLWSSLAVIFSAAMPKTVEIMRVEFRVEWKGGVIGRSKGVIGWLQWRDKWRRNKLLDWNALVWCDVPNKHHTKKT